MAVALFQQLCYTPNDGALFKKSVSVIGRSAAEVGTVEVNRACRKG